MVYRNIRFIMNPLKKYTEKLLIILSYVEKRVQRYALPFTRYSLIYVRISIYSIKTSKLLSSTRLHKVSYDIFPCSLIRTLQQKHQAQ